MDIKINLKKFIVTEMMFEKDTTLLNDDQHLLETGIIDSMDILVFLINWHNTMQVFCVYQIKGLCPN